MVITLFSAPNYCQMYKNKAAVIKLNQNNLDVDQFKFTPAPYILPSYMNLFEWSLPFVSEKIIDIYSELYKHIKRMEDEEISSDKYLKAINDVKNDDSLKDKINFLERKRQESQAERKKKD